MIIGDKLPVSFYLKEDVKEVAKMLLGKLLVTNLNDERTSGIITETEAYEGAIDKASHAFGNRRTKRTETMFAKGGCAYVYLCYGIHEMFNVVTGNKNVPHAVLIRALEPYEGVEIMKIRRKKSQLDYSLCTGPGSLTQALGISREHNGISLNSKTVCICETDIVVPTKHIIASPRVGVQYAEDHALWHNRFRLKNSKWTSKPK